MTEKLHQRLDREANERRLWDRPRAEVREELILHFKCFAEALASIKAERNPQLDVDDVTQESLIGLIRAVDTFDPQNAKGASFTTFAGWRCRGQSEEVSRSADWVSHKVRAADRELRLRLEAGDETADATSLLPMMNVTSFVSTKPSEGDGLVMEPTDRGPSSGIEAATLKLEKMLGAAEPVVARYAREALEAQYDPDVISKRTDVATVLAKRWQMSPEGAATLFRACIAALQAVHVAA